ncbi:hypothetical protein XCR1_1120008 [Xenorhabdus cabanillasii JM26]|uniref:Uncharacterized protein n=1 Tax=Xenorhabdus cabanillasii JM26 TaxID=1427517 RepID=W1ILG7_9GAMM|nr:hypothetical protein XCR1_1120008 [Xenorhabdus cabanillasii JM26]
MALNKQRKSYNILYIIPSYALWISRYSAMVKELNQPTKLPLERHWIYINFTIGLSHEYGIYACTIVRTPNQLYTINGSD